MGEPNDTDPKRAKIVAAAAKIFGKYGFARTTIGDIAEAAGVSRPSVYTLFPGKDEIFAAVVSGFTAYRLAAIREGVARRPTLQDKLLFACDLWSVEAHEAVLANPDARDLSDLAFPCVRAGYDRFQELLTEMLHDAVSASRLRVSAGELARVIAFSIRGFKDTAQTGKELRRLIAGLIATVALALTER